MVTRREFGLIGRGISHSFSAEFFSGKFSAENINAEYRPFDLPSLDLFPNLIRENPSLAGLNVTSPYKREIIPYLDSLSDEAAGLKAVNVIKFIKSAGGDTILAGHNSDAEGFRATLRNLPLPAQGDTAAMILGTGGAASAVAFALRQMDIPFVFVSRNPESFQGSFDTVAIGYREAAKALDNHNLIINATPAGMWPHTESLPPLNLEKIGRNHICYDLIYNPRETLFLREAGQRGAYTVNGMQMLVNQAELSWKIWNS